MNNNDPIVNLNPGLYLVATPIGNLRDVTLRALDILRAADMVLCEDTRVTGKLLNAYGVRTPMEVYNDHSHEGRREAILERIRGGARAALVSDAGTPLVSDPGYKLARAAMERGIAVTSAPGASAALTALQLSGLPSDAFCFAGFLPPKARARIRKLESWRDAPGTLIFYETGPRLAESLAAMLDILGDRQAAVIREMTKLYEEARRGPLSRLAGDYAGAPPPKGEIAVAVAPRGEAGAADDGALDSALEGALASLSLRDAVAAVAAATGRARKEVYARALAMAARRP